MANNDDNVTCWFGATCENRAEFDVEHGHEAFGSQRHGVCRDHLHAMVDHCVTPVHGWGRLLPVVITVKA